MSAWARESNAGPQEAAAKVKVVSTETLSTNGAVLQVSVVGPESIALSKQAMFQITVSNASDNEVRDLIFSVPIPGHVGLVSSEATNGQPVFEGGQGDGKVVWRLSQLPAHGRATGTGGRCRRQASDTQQSMQSHRHGDAEERSAAHRKMGQRERCEA